MAAENIIVNWRRQRRERAHAVDDETLRLIEEAEADTTGVRSKTDPRTSFSRRPPFNFPLVPVTQPHYRRAADNYAEAPDGTVQCWNGIDKPLRFDSAVGSWETVGVIAPVDTPSLSGNGSGPLVGTFTAYVRFVDRSGNFSSFSPISNEFTPVTSVGNVTDASYTSPIVITTDVAHNLGTGQIVKIAGVFGNAAANGIWEVIVLTSTTFSLYAGGGVASEASGTYVNGGTVTTGVSQFVYSNVGIPTESKVTRRQILRNKDGDTSVYFVDIDTTDLTSSTFVSQTDDASLVNEVPLFDDNNQSLVDKSLPLTSKKIVASCLGRMFCSGNEPYTEGAVAVTNGSTTVTGIGVEWGQITFVGRFLEVAGGNKRYQIESMQSASSLTLTEAYSGSTDAYAYYTIYNGPDERRTIYWTPPGQPEAWPFTDTLTLAEDPGAGEITALVPLRSWLYIGQEKRLHRFSFVNDPLYDGEVVPAANRGLVNNHVWVKIDDIMYGMDTLGFYQYAGNDLNDISTPGVQDLFRNRQSSAYRINWNAKRSFHAVYDPGEATIRWYVCIGNSYAPQHAVCYHVRLRRWWLEEYPFPIGASCLGRLNGKSQAFLGTDGKRIMALHQSTLDAVDPGAGTVRGTVTDSGYDWIADSTASFSSTLPGQEIAIVGGKGMGQRRRIISVASTRLNMLTPWTDRPDTTSSYQVGGVTWRWRSGWLQFMEGENEMQRGMSIQYKPTTNTAEMHLRMYEDLDTAPTTWVQASTLADGNGIAWLVENPNTYLSIDSTKSNGFIRQRIPGMREFVSDAPRYLSVELGGVSNSDSQSILNVILDEIRR